MNDSRVTAYVQQVLALDPRTEPEAVLRCRREFLRPTDAIVAKPVDVRSDDLDLRSRMLRRLNAIRDAFWTLDVDELARRLASLQNAAHVETATAAARLQHVARQREAIQALSAEPGVHSDFLTTLAQILVAPTAEANRLRERMYRSMRPEQNRHHDSARRAIQYTVHVMRSKYPNAFQLEEAWLTELLEYDPVQETPDECVRGLFGLATLAGLVATLISIVCILVWIFS